ncbi:MAG: DTW domain-containing protein [Deltaproteobacteria bacterium]|nr:DTW domain-containing protein [Deltaproteobacteria bacterium]
MEVSDSNSNPDRKYCYRCFKPAVTCICNDIPSVNNKTKILILQHPLERNHPLGTARFAALGLNRCDLKIPYSNSENKLTYSLHNSMDIEDAALLYPSADAKDISTLDYNKIPSTLIVIDGTWSNARQIYRDNLWLQNLPHLSLNPHTPSRYRIRLEPTDAHISTIEAIVMALKKIEPETSNLDKLLTAFDSMIDKQIEYIKLHNSSRRVLKPKKKKPKTIPQVLFNGFKNIVVIYAESIRLSNNENALISFTAKRMVSGESLEIFLKRDELFFSDDHFEHSGIKDKYLKEAIDVDLFLINLKEFLKPDDYLCPWNKGTLKALFNLMNCEDKKNIHYLFLKSVYGNTVKEKYGNLEDVAEKLNLKVETHKFTGRADERMARAIAVAEYLHTYSNP